MRAINILLLAFSLWLSACANLPGYGERRELAETLARVHGWHAVILPAPPFELTAYLPPNSPPDDYLTVYIEGDGFAWISASQPSYDPTPRDPVGLKMALAHPGGNVAYLARPCQYVDAEARHCPQRYWTGQRFAPEVIEALSKALDELKVRFHARQLTLVGYSGGGAAAALLAAGRKDVVRLVTVAGNLDHRAWTKLHRVAPLAGSLNPADDRKALARIPQVHFVGAMDRTVPPEIAQEFVAGLPSDTQAQIRIVPGYDHRCCWAENWATLWAEVP